MKNFLKICIAGINTPKGMRKPRRYLFEIDRVDSIELVNEGELILKAKSEIKRMNKVESCNIIVNQAQEDGEMVFVALLPIKTIKVEV